VIQRVREARLDVDGKPFSAIGPGFVVLVGYGAGEMKPGAGARAHTARERLLDKLLGLRVFPDEAGKMNVDLEGFGGEVLVVSQFTLYADCRKGKRPSFHLAAPPDQAEAAYDALVETMNARLPGRVKTGSFGADMDVRLTNWGPVTLMLDSDDF
jgi:D-tyrosyl-tRNA(Tyr) deacylase